MAYQFASGHNNTGGLTAVDPQPACEGIVPSTVVEGMDGFDYEQGFSSCEWVFSCATAEQAADLYTAFGLTSVRSVACTIRTSLNDSESGGIRAFGNFNAIIHKPSIGKEGTYRYWWKNLKFRLTRLEAL